MTLDDLNLAELRAVYRNLGGTDEHYDPAILRRLISTRSVGDVHPTPRTPPDAAPHNQDTPPAPDTDGTPHEHHGSPAAPGTTRPPTHPGTPRLASTRRSPSRATVTQHTPHTEHHPLERYTPNMARKPGHPAPPEERHRRTHPRRSRPLPPGRRATPCRLDLRRDRRPCRLRQPILSEDRLRRRPQAMGHRRRRGGPSLRGRTHRPALATSLHRHRRTRPGRRPQPARHPHQLGDPDLRSTPPTVRHGRPRQVEISGQDGGPLRTDVGEILRERLRQLEA